MAVSYYIDINQFGEIESNKFITKGGTSSQFVKGDGSLDPTSYATSDELDTLDLQAVTDVDNTTTNDIHTRGLIVDSSDNGYTHHWGTLRGNLNTGDGLLVVFDTGYPSSSKIDLKVTGASGRGYSEPMDLQVETYYYSPSDDIRDFKAVSNFAVNDISAFSLNENFAMWIPLFEGSSTSFWTKVLDLVSISLGEVKIQSASFEPMPTTGVARLVAIPVKKRILEGDGNSLLNNDAEYATETWVSNNFDNYQSFNLKTEGLQRTTIQSGGDVNFVGGNNTTVNYSAGGTVTINSSFNDTTYNAGTGLDLTGTQFSFDTAWGDGRYLQTETDPIFTASPAFGISNTDITNWNEKGVQLTADQPTANIHLRDSAGAIISTLNVGFLNNEGTTIFFNSATDEIELKDDAGNVLSSFPASALMTGVGFGLNLTGSTLDLVDSANNVIDSVTLTIANIQGLQSALNGKVDDFGLISDADVNLADGIYGIQYGVTGNIPFDAAGLIVKRDNNQRNEIAFGGSGHRLAVRRWNNGNVGVWREFASQNWVTSQLPTVNNGLITINPQGILTGGGSFNLNQGSDETLNITAPSFGTTAGTVAEGNHTHSQYLTSTDTIGLSANTGGLIQLSSGADLNTINKSNAIITTSQTNGPVTENLIVQTLAYNSGSSAQLAISYQNTNKLHFRSGSDLSTATWFTAATETWSTSQFSLQNHTHSASDITSGTFPYSRLPISAAQVSNWGDAYAHSNITSGNPHGVSYSNILGSQPIPTLQEIVDAEPFTSVTFSNGFNHLEVTEFSPGVSKGLMMRGGSNNKVEVQQTLTSISGDNIHFSTTGAYHFANQNQALGHIPVCVNGTTGEVDWLDPSTLSWGSTNISGNLSGTTLNVNSSTGTDANISLAAINLDWVLENGSSAVINGTMAVTADVFALNGDRVFLTTGAGSSVDITTTGLKIDDGTSGTGTAGQVLTSNGTYAKWEDAVSTTDTTLIARVTLSAAQIKSLNSNPVTIIPAPGPGKYIIVKGSTYKLNYGGTPFNVNNHTGLEYPQSGGHLDIWPRNAVQGEFNKLQSLINSSSSIARYFAIDETYFGAQENTAVEFGSFTSDATQGNGTLEIAVYYDII